MKLKQMDKYTSSSHHQQQWLIDKDTAASNSPSPLMLTCCPASITKSVLMLTLPAFAAVYVPAAPLLITD